MHFEELMDKIAKQGIDRDDRTGVGTRSLFGEVLRYDLSEAFPIIESRRVYPKNVARELLWFLSGSTNINDLDEKARHWWSPWADEEGDLGPTYGVQWRGDDSGRFVDQFSNLIRDLKMKPDSRRHVGSLWDAHTVHETRLHPCHGTMIQFYVRGDYLDMMTHQRSADVFIGLPHNLISYGFLLHIVAAMTVYEPGKMIYTLGDAHIYQNHFPYVELQLQQHDDWLARKEYGKRPQLHLPAYIDSVEELELSMFEISNYNPEPAIKGAPIAV